MLKGLDYPRWRYHPTKGGKVVYSEQEAIALGDGWCENVGVVQNKALLDGQILAQNQRERSVVQVAEVEETKPVAKKRTRRRKVESDDGVGSSQSGVEDNRG